MKKKVWILPVIVLLVVILLFDKRINYYCHYAIPNEKYFGEHYKELLCPMSVSDKKQATEIMKKVEEAFSFIGSKEDADGRFGELSRYCITEEAAMKESHDLKLLTADFDNNKGYLWFVYNQEISDKNNQTIRGSRDILSYVTVEKTAEGWVVVDTDEHP